MNQGLLKSSTIFSLTITFLLIGLSATQLLAQCPSCTPVNCAANFPEGGIYTSTCDTVLPPATVGVYYEDVVSFYMPKTIDDPSLTQGQADYVELERLVIGGVSGLPFGFEYNFSAGGEYRPIQGDTLGCATFCGTSVAPGVYNVSVNIIADVIAHGTPIGTVSVPGQSFVYETQITVEFPPGTGNIQATVPAGCDSVRAAFSTLLNFPPNITTWNWDYGNGQVGNGQEPGDTINFNSIGEHPVILTTTEYQYVLTEVVLNAVNDADWCGDVEEVRWPLAACGTNCCVATPDLFYEIIDNANVIHTGSRIDDALFGTWNNLNIPLDIEQFVIQFWDYDAVSANDDLGQFIINVSLGSIPFSGGGASGSVFIDTVVSMVQSDTFLVQVHPSPDTPTITAVGLDTICNGDSTVLIIDNPNGLFVQWYKDSVLIPLETNAFYVARSSGHYAVQVADPVTGCLNASPVFSVVVAPNPPSNVNIINLGNGQLGVSSFPGFDVQWYFEGQAILGGNTQTIDATQEGAYTVEIYNFAGCSTTSSAFNVTSQPTGLEIIELKDLKIYPNPANRHLTVSGFSQETTDIRYSMINLVGQLVYGGTEFGIHGSFEHRIDVSEIDAGAYMLEIQTGSTKTVKKILVN